MQHYPPPYMGIVPPGGNGHGGGAHEGGGFVDWSDDRFGKGQAKVDFRRQNPKGCQKGKGKGLALTDFYDQYGASGPGAKPAGGFSGKGGKGGGYAVGGYHHQAHSHQAHGSKGARGVEWMVDKYVDPSFRGGAKGGNKPSRSNRDKQYNKIINRQVTLMAELGDLAQLLDVIQVYLPDMNGLNLTTSFHRVAKLSTSEGDFDRKVNLLKHHPVFERLLHDVVSHIKNHTLYASDYTVTEEQIPPSEERTDGWEMPVQCMSIVCWSCATLRIRDRMLFTTIAKIVSPRIDHLKSFELSNLLWAYAKVALVPAELFKNAGERIVRRRGGEFKAQCLSTIAWSFATAERRHGQVFNTLAEEIKATASSLKTQEISNTLWAFAKSRSVDVDLFDTLGNTAVQEPMIWMFKSQELSNTVWAFATVGIQHPILFEKIEAAVIQKRFDMLPQNIANILWSYAKLQVIPRSNMFPALLEVASTKLSEYKRQELSTVIWAAAQVCPNNGEFFGVATRVCCHRLKEFSPNAVANLTRDLSAVATTAPQAFREILSEGARRLSQFDPGALCILLRGALGATSNPAISGHLPELWERVSAICQQLLPRIHRLRVAELQDVSDTLWTKAPDNERLTALDEAIRTALQACQERRDPAYQGKAEARELEQEYEDGREPRDGRDSESGTRQPRSEVLSLDARYVESYTTKTQHTRYWAGSFLEMGQAAAQPAEQLYSAWPVDGGVPPPGFIGADQAAAWTGQPGMIGDQGEQDWSGWPPQLPSMLKDDINAAVPAWRGADSTACASAAYTRENFDVATTSAKLALHASQALREIKLVPELLDLGGDPWQSSQPSRDAKGAKVEEGESQVLAGSNAVSETSEEVGQASGPSPQVLNSSCVIEQASDGSLQPVNLSSMASEPVLGVHDQCIRLRHGVIDARIVLKVIPPKITFSEGDLVQHPNVLTPLAVINCDADGQRRQCVAYTHCENGTLAKWVTQRSMEGNPLQPNEVARVVYNVLLGAEASHISPEVVSMVQPSTIFVDEHWQPRLRRPLGGRPAGWGDQLKWLSPDEASGKLVAASDMWPALSYRLGMLLYCISTGTCMDPYPQKTGEETLMELLQESDSQASALRPDMAQYQGPEILRRLVAACLRIGEQEPPAIGALKGVLKAMGSVSA